VIKMAWIKRRSMRTGDANPAASASCWWCAICALLRQDRAGAGLRAYRGK
jgi:hypothetical protein